jgi:hypothetical protein
MHVCKTTLDFYLLLHPRPFSHLSLHDPPVMCWSATVCPCTESSSSRRMCSCRHRSRVGVLSTCAPAAITPTRGRRPPTHGPRRLPLCRAATVPSSCTSVVTGPPPPTPCLAISVPFAYAPGGRGSMAGGGAQAVVGFEILDTRSQSGCQWVVEG